MRKLLLVMSLLINAIALCAQKSEVVLQSNMEYGKALEFSIDMVEGSTVKIDWGDGTIKEHKTKTAWGTSAAITGKSLGETIHIYGSLKALETRKSRMTSLRLVSQNGLTRLDASDNELTYENLDLNGAPNLVNLTLDNNDLVMLNLMAFEKLEIFSVNNNKRFTTAVFADHNVLRNISMSNCDVAHFYPKPMPELTYLTIDNGDLTELELGENYPKLAELSVAGHQNLSKLDVTTLPKLEKLDISNTAIQEINTTRNPELVTFNAPHTGLRNLSLAYNTKLQNVDVAVTKISRLDVNKLGKLRNIRIDSTDIDRLDLTGKIYLSNVSARNTKIEFLDMHDQIGYNSLRWLDLRDNKNMTAQTLNYTFQMMPFHNGNSWSTNVWIKGVPGAETSKTDLLTSDADNCYKVDIKGDGSAPTAPIALTVKSTLGGTVSLSQIQNDYSWTDISTEAKPGYPVSITASPQPGYEFAGVKVNGKLYEDTIFVTSTDAMVEPIFHAETNEQVIKLTVSPGAIQQYFLGGEFISNTILIDWGDGEKIPYIIGNGTTSVANENGAAGNTVTITGPVAYADFSSYPGYGIDNEIKGIDLTKASKLRSLSTYFNDIKTIDVSNILGLENLDVAYSGISSLNISQNPKLKELRAYGNSLTSLDITTAPELTYLDAKNNSLTGLNTTKNNRLQTLLVQGNKLTTLDVAAMTELTELDFSDNQVEEINVSNAPELKKFAASKNKLTTVDLSKNVNLQSVLLDNNHLVGLDLHNQNYLAFVQVGGNGWDACTLNDLYYSLPQYPDLHDSQWATGNTLWVTDTQAARENDAAHAESDIAASKGWKVNTEGDGSGCDMAYITILETRNGTVELKDAKGNVIKSGDKVQKNNIVTMKTIPASGYAVASSKANGKDIVNNQFTVTKATDVAVRFSVSDGIDTAETGTVVVTPARQAVIISTDKTTRVSIFTTNGQSVYENDVDGTQTVQLKPALYIVKVGAISKTILVQ